jgi:hypothetical protein
MENIVRYTNKTPIVNIIYDLYGDFYHKHCDWQNRMLDEEIPIVKNAIKQFAKELGEIKSKNTIWKTIYFDHYIKFKNLDNGDYFSYFDLEEIDRRYIDLSMEKWHKGLVEF